MAAPVGFMAAPVRFMAAPVRFVPAPVRFMADPLVFVPDPVRFVVGPVRFAADPVSAVIAPAPAQPAPRARPAVDSRATAPAPMARIVQTGDTPAKRRRAHVRSAAEAIRRLAARDGLAAGVYDDEARDLVAYLALHLRGVGETIEAAAQAWDDRDYWRKSEKLRADYRWAPQAAAEIERAAVAQDWDAVTGALVGLVPRFAAVTITRETRDADHWVGAYRALVRRATAPAGPLAGR